MRQADGTAQVDELGHMAADHVLPPDAVPFVEAPVDILEAQIAVAVGNQHGTEVHDEAELLLAPDEARSTSFNP
jgi:hypothetical protein